MRPLPSPATGLPRLPVSPSLRAVPTTPADRNGCIRRLLPRSTRPSPNLRRVGVHIFTFEACSGFTRVRPALPGINKVSLSPFPIPARAATRGDVEAATLARDGPPPITRITFLACRAHYPGGPERVHSSVTPPPFHAAFPVSQAGRPTISLSRPAQTSLAFGPLELNRPRRPLSRASLPTAPPRQLPDQPTTHLPPLVSAC